MKKATANISNYKRLASVLLGVVMAVVIVFGQVTSYDAPENIQENEQQTNEDSSEDILVLKAADAIASSVQVNLTHQYYFISEIIFADEPSTSGWHIATPVLTTFMHTLFRQIISPNAP